MNRKAELENWLQELKETIQKMQQKLRPELEQLDHLRKQLSYVNELLLTLGGQPSSTIPDTSTSGSSVVWADICQEHGWTVGGDSAHRVVRRKSSSLHESIPHFCPYDKRRYP
ncbi:MAG: hypothetical protein HYX82_05635 [Chloroflexi bacterium]|nr:hypothetical protein [Chloroflexota bacterium]